MSFCPRALIARCGRRETRCGRVCTALARAAPALMLPVTLQLVSRMIQQLMDQEGAAFMERRFEQV